MERKPGHRLTRGLGVLFVTFLVMAIPSWSHATDADTDGVPDTIDQCPDTVPDTGTVPRRELKVGHFVLTNLGSGATFETREPAQTSFSIDDTAGCSCAQLIEKLHLGKEARRFGCSIETLEAWNRFVYTTPLLATGQTIPGQAIKNDGENEFVEVPDDGALQLGIPLKYRDNGDGTITDLSSHLTWEKKCDCPGTDHHIANTYRWSGNGTQDTIWDWIDRLNAANYGGYSDWRIPNFREMDSLLHSGRVDGEVDDLTCPDLPISTQFDPAVDPVFHNCGDSVSWGTDYWTSTTDSGNPNKVIPASFRFGYSSRTAKSATLPVRAVRGDGMVLATGQVISYPADKNDGIDGPVTVPDDGSLQRGTPLNLVNNGDGSITDLNTGLTWEVKCETSCDSSDLHHVDQVLVWSRKADQIDDQDTIWDWLEAVNFEGHASHHDWRISNYRELLSIVNFGRPTPMVDPLFDDDLEDSQIREEIKHWTSTIQGDNSTKNVYYIWFLSDKTTFTQGFEFRVQAPWPVRAVRGGRLTNEFSEGSVIIDECQTGVPNYRMENGDTISELIEQCAIGAKNHKKFVKCVRKLTKDLKRNHVILKTQKQPINWCAKRADLP